MKYWTKAYESVEAVRLDHWDEYEPVFNEYPDWLAELRAAAKRWTESGLPYTEDDVMWSASDGLSKFLCELSTSDGKYYLEDGDYVVKLGDKVLGVPSEVFERLFVMRGY